MPSVLRPAPRELPARLTLRLLFGAWMALVGWFLAAFGMIFVLVFAPEGEVFTPDYDRNTVATITSVEKTNMSSNDNYVYRVNYTFVDDAGRTRRGASYSYDSEFPETHRVEYVASSAEESRLEGLRSKPFGALVLIVLVMPMVGLGIGLHWLRAGVLARRLLRTGIETRGKLLELKETHVHVNKRPVQAATFEYDANGRTYKTTIKTLDPTRLKDDPLEPMLYDAQDPTRATTLDNLPGMPRIVDGKLDAAPGIALHALLCPIVFVCEAAVGVWWLVT